MSKRKLTRLRGFILRKDYMKKRKELINYLNTFKYLTNQEKMFLLQKNKSEIEKYAIRRKRALRFKLRRYIVEKLGLTMDDPEIFKIF
jgi:excinuclease UvrABC nuclease subunit